jgi:hypothetical protein
MSRLGFAAIIAIGLAAGACSSSREPTYGAATYGAAVVVAPGDPVVAFAERRCTAGTFTGHGVGYSRCIDQMETAAGAGGPNYVAALRAD